MTHLINHNEANPTKEEARDFFFTFVFKRKLISTSVLFISIPFCPSMTSPSPSPNSGSFSSQPHQPNNNCLVCKKICATAPIYLLSPVALSEIRPKDLHPICSACQSRPRPKGRTKTTPLRRLSIELNGTEVKELVRKYKVDDYKSSLWELAMITSGFKYHEKTGEKESLQPDSEGRKSPMKSVGMGRVRDGHHKVSKLF